MEFEIIRKNTLTVISDAKTAGNETARAFGYNVLKRMGQPQQ